MTVHEYLQLVGIKEDSYELLAFQIAENKMDKNNFPYWVYHSSPCRNVREWYGLDYTDPKKRVRAKIFDYIVLNPQTYDISWLSGASWNNWIKHGHMKMMLVVSKEELLKQYSERQAEELVNFIDKVIKKQITQ